MTTEVVWVRPETTLKEAVALLLEHGVGGLPVLDRGGRVVGMVTESDLVRVRASSRADGRKRRGSRSAAPETVADVMSQPAITVEKNTPVPRIARLIVELRIGQVPVTEDGRLAGIVSRRDLIRSMARADDDIRRDIESLLDDKILFLGRFEVAVHSGIVTLLGASDPQEGHLAEALARSVPGVLAVVVGEAAIGPRSTTAH
jgi:CBS domain-containing protein